MASSNLSKRLILGCTLGPIVFFGVLFEPVFSLVLFLSLSLISIHEYSIMLQSAGQVLHRSAAFVMVILVLLDLYYLGGAYWPLIYAVYFLVSLFFSVFTDRAGIRFLIPIHAGVLYITLGFGLLLYFLHPVHVFHWQITNHSRFVTLLILMIWALDTTAYFIGKAYGTHFLAPSISPKKTWEGAIAGLCGVFITGIVCKWLYVDFIDTTTLLILCSIVGISGQIGDLIESYFKRRVQVKDSSSFLPGHGGILDRFDALIFTTIVVYLYLQIQPIDFLL